MHLTSKTTRRLIVLVVMSVALGGGYVGLKKFRQAQAVRIAVEQRDEGMRAYLAGDYAAALQPLSDALVKNKQDVELIIAFADTRSKVPERNKKHIYEAIQRYNDALRIDSDNLDALQKLLDLYESARIGEIRDFFDTASAVLKIEPDHIQARAAVASYYQSQRQLSSAITELKRLQELDPENIEWRLRHLSALKSSGATDREQQDLVDGWLAEWQGDGRMHFVKAYLYYGSGLHDNAGAEAKLAAESGVGSADVHHSLVMLLDDLDMHLAADQLVADAKEAFPDEPWVWNEAIRRPWLRRDLSQAAAELEQAEDQFATLAPNLLKWKVLIHLFQGEMNDVDTSLASLRDRAARVDDHEQRDSLRAWATALGAYAKLRQSQWSEARSAFASAIALAPDDAVLNFILGEAFSEVAEHDLAAEYYAAAWRLEPDWLEAGMAYGDTLLQLGRPQEALQAAAKMGLRGDRVDTPVIPLFVRSWLATCSAFGSIDEVTRSTGVSLFQITSTLERFRAAMDINQAPDLAGMLYDAYRLEGNADGARALTEDILALAGGAAAPLLLVAARGSELAGLDHAPELVERAEAKDGLSYSVVESKSWLMMRDDQFESGLELIEKAMRESRAIPDSGDEQWQRLRALYLALADDPRAASAFSELLDDYPNSADLPGFILAQRAAWSDQGLIERSLEKQREIIGDRGSTRLLLSEASYTLLFHSDDGAQVAQATDQIRQALIMSPKSLIGLTLMADALLKTRPPQFRDAIDYLEQAVSSYPARVDLYPKIISLYQQISDFSTAGEWLTKLARRNDLSSGMRQVELALLDQQGDWQTAIERIVSRGELSDDDDKLALASLYVRTGDFDDAEAIVDELLAGPEHNELAVRFAAELYALTDRTEKAITLLHSRPATGGAGAKNARLGSLYRRAGRLVESIDSLRRAVDDEPANASYWNELTLTYLRAGQYDNARSAAESGLELEPGHSGLLSNYALACLDADDQTREKAIQMLSADGDQHAALIETLRLYERINGEDPDAHDLQGAAQLVKDYPEFLPAIRLAVNLYVVAGKLDRALALADDAMNQHPNDPSPCEWATDLSLRMNNLNQAQAYAEKWRRRSPTDPMKPDVVLAQIHLKLDQPREAAEYIGPYFEKVMAAWEDDRVRAFAAVRALLADGQFGRVATVVRPLLDTHQVWRDAWINLSPAMNEMTAEQMLALLEELIVGTPEGKLTIAGAWHQHGRRTGDDAHFERGVLLANEAMRESPRVEIAANLLLGTIAEARSRDDEAEHHYMRVLELDENNVYAMNNLAFILSKDESTLDRARALSQQLVELQPGIGAFLDTHATVLLRLGETSEAEMFATRAVDADPNAVDIKLTLAEILLRANKLDEALEVAENAQEMIEQNPQFDATLAEEATDLIQRIRDARSDAGVN